MANQNLTLLTDLYELTMMQGYFNEQSNDTVIFDAFYRTNPDGNGFAIAAGLEQVVEYIENLHFDKEDIDYLRTTGLFGEDFQKTFSNILPVFILPVISMPFRKEVLCFPRNP